MASLQAEGYGGIPELEVDTSGLVSRLAVLPMAWQNDLPPLPASGSPDTPRQLEDGRGPGVDVDDGRWEPSGSPGRHWRLEGQIGRGSFGEVWHASRFGALAKGARCHRKEFLAALAA